VRGAPHAAPRRQRACVTNTGKRMPPRDDDAGDAARARSASEASSSDSRSRSRSRSGGERKGGGGGDARREAKRAAKRVRRLCRAARKGRVSKLRSLLRKHDALRVDDADARGLTPLQHAARCAWLSLRACACACACVAADAALCVQGGLGGERGVPAAVRALSLSLGATHAAQRASHTRAHSR
jgi:hypothetical protein